MTLPYLASFYVNAMSAPKLLRDLFDAYDAFVNGVHPSNATIPQGNF
jgi:hypothetical protein